MKLKLAILLQSFLWIAILYSQDKRVFEPDYPWMSYEEALLSNPDSVFYLDLSRSKLKEIPKAIYQFKHLKALSLEGMKLENISLQIGRFKSLTYVNFSKNKLTSFPVVVCQLKKLETLVVSRNALIKIPDCIANLKKLKYMDLWNTQIINLPPSMDKMKNLLYIDMQGINIGPKTQESFHRRFPNTKFELDLPCNCFR